MRKLLTAAACAAMLPTVASAQETRFNIAPPNAETRFNIAPPKAAVAAPKEDKTLIDIASLRIMGQEHERSRRCCRLRCQRVAQQLGFNDRLAQSSQSRQVGRGIVYRDVHR
jgi:hypothetical protein